ncbi:hypothetical protein AAF712_009391 [Marasmius tenuissimus]|uniref:Uncharacterized protein n=1 Tax=Marasmius tenuissimus TaxID=585030 RepID=A0ABR2ZS62_9AGAR
MLLGGDTIHIALARAASSRPIVPIAFSFGWLSYSFSSILTSRGRLAPQPDCPSSIIVEVGSGYARTINSWSLSRLLSDFDHPKQVTCERGLTISFFKSTGGARSASTPKRRTGVPSHGWDFSAGILCILIQLGISIIPGLLRHNWQVPFLVSSGTLLAQFHGRLPQWKQELWNSREIQGEKDKVFCLTRGNGSPDVIVIQSPPGDLNLSDIAGARRVPSRTTLPATCLLAVCWGFLVYNAQRASREDARYLIAIGIIGMVHNVVAARRRYTPEAAGFHLEEWILSHEKDGPLLDAESGHEMVRENVIHNDKVFKALQLAEEVEEGVGVGLVPVFFPGNLREDEEEWFESKVSTRR